jgi:hypothetical protein
MLVVVVETVVVVLLVDVVVSVETVLWSQLLQSNLQLALKLADASQNRNRASGWWSVSVQLGSSATPLHVGTVVDPLVVTTHELHKVGQIC